VTWPALPYEEWRETRDTLHMYTQVVGKLRLALSPSEPQWGQVPFYLTSRGLTTSPMPVGERTMDAEFDLVAHELVMRTSDGITERRHLGGAVADFHADVLNMLARMEVDAVITTLPAEVNDPIRFPEDRTHRTYVPEQANRFFRVLSMVDSVLKEHRARFRGRVTPVQFYWGTFDLAVTRYSGRAVEPPSDRGVIAKVSGDAEVICAGWWPGDERRTEPTFFAYGYPAPAGMDSASIAPDAAAWSDAAGEFLLPYDAARTAADPRHAIHQFLDSTYAATAQAMRWDKSLSA
jgi:Family of unknown function (DUF5996)